jgi:RimJ/RimL family protein N-acetyltransferase
MDSGNRSRHLDKLGEPFEIGKCSQDCLSEILDMYEAFSPKAVTQGLPPADEEQRHLWVKSFFPAADNFVVWKSGKIVGHCALIADMDRLDAEYLIFVLGPEQNRGIGTLLTEMAVNHAIQLGLKILWLTVEAYNFRAIRMYKNAGFEFYGECDRERTMLKRL